MSAYHLFLYLVAAGLAALGLFLAIVPPAELRAQSDPDHPFAGYGRMADARFPAWRGVLGVVLLFGALLAAGFVRADEPHRPGAGSGVTGFMMVMPFFGLAMMFFHGARLSEDDAADARWTIAPATRRRLGIAFLVVGAAEALLLVFI
jgi:hypothetical protein